MLEATNLKAFQMAQKMGLETAKEHVKKLMQIAHETLENEPNVENSCAFKYWCNVSDELDLL
jgi:selenocysteine lyase/cysteine desulfurase